MRVGTKSVLFGVHQFIWHPVTVLLAWLELYGRPTWKEFLAIIIHDWGYWGLSDMDGAEGKAHPLRMSEFAWVLGGTRTQREVLYHSREMSRFFGGEPSKLAYADKLSLRFDPWWLYLPRASLSGELKEYRARANVSGFCSGWMSNRYWYGVLKQHYLAFAKRAPITPKVPAVVLPPFAQGTPEEIKEAVKLIEKKVAD